MAFKTYYSLIVQVLDDIFCVDVSQDSFNQVMDKIPHSIICDESEKDCGVFYARYFAFNGKYLGFVSQREILN